MYIVQVKREQVGKADHGAAGLPDLIADAVELLLILAPKMAAQGSQAIHDSRALFCLPEEGVEKHSIHALYRAKSRRWWHFGADSQQDGALQRSRPYRLARVADVNWFELGPRPGDFCFAFFFEYNFLAKFDSKGPASSTARHVAGVASLGVGPY